MPKPRFRVKITEYRWIRCMIGIRADGRKNREKYHSSQRGHYIKITKFSEPRNVPGYAQSENQQSELQNQCMIGDRQRFSDQWMRVDPLQKSFPIKAERRIPLRQLSVIEWAIARPT